MVDNASTIDSRLPLESEDSQPLRIPGRWNLICFKNSPQKLLLVFPRNWDLAARSDQGWGIKSFWMIAISVSRHKNAPHSPNSNIISLEFLEKSRKGLIESIIDWCISKYLQLLSILPAAWPVGQFDLFRHSLKFEAIHNLFTDIILGQPLYQSGLALSVSTLSCCCNNNIFHRTIITKIRYSL